ncbi:MAG: hypothetical protein CML60_10545 [Rhodobacteraceae bacterium]|nr:hypothetical protein [Paracoccaceae bacterium]MBT26815.1 hypothetical protein [Paracoccaceae bacterium]
MTRTRPPQLSFSAGELSPLLWARSDYQRFQTGARQANGYLPIREGGFTRAPGTLFRGYTHGNAMAQKIRFEFSVDDTLTLEFTDGVMRVWRYGALIEVGGVPYELTIPYTADEIGTLSAVQSADVIYIADGKRPIQKLSRYALDNWTIEDAQFDNGPFAVQNLDENLTIGCSAETGTITLTASADLFDATWQGVLMQIVPKDYQDIPLWTGNTTVAVGDLMRYGGNIYELTAGTDTGVNPPIHTEGEYLYDKDEGTKWLFVSDGRGVFRITGVTDAVTATAEVLKAIPSPCVTGTSYRWSEGAWSDRKGYPKALEIFDQSFFAAFTPSEPRTIWASTLGDFEDFEPSADADGSFAYAIAGSESLNSGTWLKRARRGLYVGALGEVYRAFSNAAGQRIGPTTFDTTIEGTDGASDAKAIAPYGNPIFISKEKRRVFELRYSLEEDGGVPVELSLPSKHLGASGFEQIVWQSSPQKIAWLRTGDGGLVAMLFDPAEDVLGWAPVSVAGGFVETMAVTSDSATGNDVVTLVVRREIDGQTVRMVEELAPTFGVMMGDEPLHKAIHLFASTVFESETPMTSFLVPHLAGQTVSVWTNQGEYGPLVVPALGQLEVPDAQNVTHAIVGLLDKTHQSETLDIVAAAPDGNATGRRRRLLPGCGVQLHRTAAGLVRAVERSFGEDACLHDLQELVPLQVASDLVAVYSGVTSIETVSGHAQQVSLQFQPFGGAPMTVLSLIPNVEEVGA